MGGKKKKSLSNRLAKMSDEEKARYLQHRAAIEEEARRRKEQLISTYLKNKLKREEAFTRLNVAKINEHWHQILRKIRIKELKTEIEDLKLWLTKVVEIKNAIIKRLMEEIEESEEQYQHNLRSHMTHINNFIDINYSRQNMLIHFYKKQQSAIEKDARAELKTIIDTSYQEERYLKTILFAMETKFHDYLKEMQKFRQYKLEEYTNTLATEFQTMVESYNWSMNKIWQDINTILREYLTQTSVRRHHYIELKHLDDRNIAERMNNERLIARYTEQLENFKHQYENAQKQNENKVQQLKDFKQLFNKELFSRKQNVTFSIRNDANKLKSMNTEACNVLKKLNKINGKADAIKTLVKCCQRLEYEKEKLIHWAKMRGILNKYEEKIQIKEKEKRKSLDEEESTSSVDTKESTILEGKEDEEKSPSEESVVSSEDYEEELPEQFKNIEKLEGIFWRCNQIEMQMLDLKTEEEKLCAENANLKKIIRGILTDVALRAPEPRETCWPVINKIRSAPPLNPNRIQMYGLEFRTVDLNRGF